MAFAPRTFSKSNCWWSVKPKLSGCRHQPSGASPRLKPDASAFRLIRSTRQLSCDGALVVQHQEKLVEAWNEFFNG